MHPLQTTQCLSQKVFNSHEVRELTQMKITAEAMQVHKNVKGVQNVDEFLCVPALQAR